MVAADGARLPLRIWPAVDASGAPITPWAVVVGLHGFDDYRAAFGLAGGYWARAGVTTYAYDQRGFGEAPGRGLWAGRGLMVADLRTVASLVRPRHPGAVLAVVGESMGGAVAVCAAADDPPAGVDRWVLDSPAVWGWGAQPPLNAAALWLLAHTLPARTLTAPSWLARRIHATDNVEELRRMGRDRRMIFSTRTDTTYGLVGLMQDARERIGRMRDPARALYLYGARDDLIPKAAAFHAAADLEAAGGRTAYYETGHHLLTRDLQRARVLGTCWPSCATPPRPCRPGRRPSPPRGGRFPRRACRDNVQGVGPPAVPIRPASRSPPMPLFDSTAFESHEGVHALP